MKDKFTNIPKIKSKTQIREAKYKYKVNDVVIYIGKIIERYHNQECTILRRSISNGKVTYKIKFNDGRITDAYEQLLVLKNVS